MPRSTRRNRTSWRGLWKRPLTSCRPTRAVFSALSVALVDRGRLIWAEAFGLAYRDAGLPATTETMFSIGSISKIVATAAALQLVERGLVELDALLPCEPGLITSFLGDTVISMKLVRFLRPFSCYGGSLPSPTSREDRPLPGALS